MWSVLLEFTTKPCSVASLEALSDFRLEAKQPSLAPGAFFMQVCTRWPFWLQKVQSAFSYNTQISYDLSCRSTSMLAILNLTWAVRYIYLGTCASLRLGFLGLHCHM